VTSTNVFSLIIALMFYVVNSRNNNTCMLRCNTCNRNLEGWEWDFWNKLRCFGEAHQIFWRWFWIVSCL